MSIVLSSVSSDYGVNCTRLLNSLAHRACCHSAKRRIKVELRTVSNAGPLVMYLPKTAPIVVVDMFKQPL